MLSGMVVIMVMRMVVVMVMVHDVYDGDSEDAGCGGDSENGGG